MQLSVQKSTEIYQIKPKDCQTAGKVQNVQKAETISNLLWQSIKLEVKRNWTLKHSSNKADRKSTKYYYSYLGYSIQIMGKSKFQSFINLNKYKIAMGVFHIQPQGHYSENQSY